MELEGYVLYEPIGFGASGPMWRAVDEAGVSHALQLLGGTLSPELESRIRTLRKLDAGNLLAFHGLRKLTDGRYVALFEYLDGQDLEVLRAGRNLSPTQVNFIALSLARGLEALHSAGLVHGDVSAANVMVTARGRVVLVDILGGPGTTPAFSAALQPQFPPPVPHRSRTSSGSIVGSGGSSPQGASDDVYAMAQVLLALGMDSRLLARALDPHSELRPSAVELAKEWEKLPQSGIELLDGSELMAARMRAAGRDVATELVGIPPGHGAGEPAMSRRRLREMQDRKPSRLLRWGIPALAGACVALVAVLLMPRFLTPPQSAQALPVAGETPNGSELIEPEDGTIAGNEGKDDKITEPGAGESSSALAPTTSTGEDNLEASPPTDLLPAGQDVSEAEPKLQDPINDDDSAKEILQSLLNLRDQALENQDRKALEGLSVTDSLVAQSDLSLLQALQESGAKIEGLSTAVKTASIVGGGKEATGTKERSVRLRVILSQGAYTQIDNIGKSHQIAAIPDVESEILLSGKPWQLASVVQLD